MSFMYKLVCKMKVCIYIYLLLIEFTKFMNHEMNFTRSSFIHETREPSRELWFTSQWKFIHLICLWFKGGSGSWTCTRVPWITCAGWTPRLNTAVSGPGPRSSQGCGLLSLIKTIFLRSWKLPLRRMVRGLAPDVPSKGFFLNQFWSNFYPRKKNIVKASILLL